MKYKEVMDALAELAATGWEVKAHLNLYKQHSRGYLEFYCGSLNLFGPAAERLSLQVPLRESYGMGPTDKIPFLPTQTNMNTRLFLRFNRQWNLRNAPLDFLLSLPLTSEFQTALSKIKCEVLRCQRQPSTRHTLQFIRAQVE